MYREALPLKTNNFKHCALPLLHTFVYFLDPPNVHPRGGGMLGSNNEGVGGMFNSNNVGGGGMFGPK